MNDNSLFRWGEKIVPKRRLHQIAAEGTVNVNNACMTLYYEYDENQDFDAQREALIERLKEQYRSIDGVNGPYRPVEFRGKQVMQMELTGMALANYREKEYARDCENTSRDRLARGL